MITPPNKIQDAINAAEYVADPIGRDAEPVTVTNAVLLTLIEAAKRLLELEE
jgi:hypothetical protein